MTAQDFASVTRQGDLAQTCPVAARGPQALTERLLELYERGLPPGDRPGWPTVDGLYTVAPGQFTVVTGWPGSGKSEWLDAVLMNLAKQGWCFCLYSAENKPDEIHLSKLAEKFIGKPFRHGPTERMSKDEIIEATVELQERFALLGPTVDSDRDTFSIDDILDGAELHWRLSGKWGDRTAKKGLVLDPWNELEHQRPAHMSETEYVSLSLTRVRSWAREHEVHVWIVAHPAKQPRENGKLPIPRPDMIAGSIHWWNKADNCVTVWREFGDPAPREVTVYVQKVRFKHIGRPGSAVLEYDIVTGRYHEPFRGLSRVVA